MAKESYYAANGAGPLVAPGSAAADFSVGDYAFVCDEYLYPHDMERRRACDYIKRSSLVAEVPNLTYRHILKSHFIRSKLLGGPINNAHLRDLFQVKTMAATGVASGA